MNNLIELIGKSDSGADLFDDKFSAIAGKKLRLRCNSPVIKNSKYQQALPVHDWRRLLIF